MEEPAEDQRVHLLMMVEKGVVLFNLRRIIADAVVGNDKIRFSKDVDACGDGLTVSALVIVLKNLTGFEILCDQTMNNGGIEAISFNVVGEFHLRFQT